MSDRREWARKTLAKLAAKIADDLPQRKNDKVLQKALREIRDSPEVEKIAAQFGGKISFTPYFVAEALPGAEAERAIGLMMHTTAYAMADQYCRPVSAKAITAKREEVEGYRAHALSLTPYDEHNERLRNLYVAFIDANLPGLVPLSDPLVERRPPTRKESDGVSDADYAHARAVRARARAEGRRIFGKAGDRVTDVFVTVATGIQFSRDDQRGRFKR